MAKAPTQVEADYRKKCEEELEDLYAEVPWRPDFVERYSSPMVTISAVWTVVDEVFSPKGRIPQPEWDQIRRASHFFGRLLRHGENDRWAPMRDGNQSICMELAYNVALLRGVLAPSCTPADIYTCLKLREKDRDRGRFHLLLRNATFEESCDPVTKKYVIQKGPHDAPHPNGSGAQRHRERASHADQPEGGPEERLPRLAHA